jgi:Na+/melibiose symporter-like transporter|tara:strand:- start:1291 stop:1524 length:234 start_codon:yes stop_codon:yes gene_type:complete
MDGGGLSNVFANLFVKNPQKNSFIVMVVSIILKTIIVMVTYNKIWPRLVENTGQDTSKFKPLTFFEAFLFVILFMFL